MAQPPAIVVPARVGPKCAPVGDTCLGCPCAFKPTQDLVLLAVQPWRSFTTFSPTGSYRRHEYRRKSSIGLYHNLGVCTTSWGQTAMPIHHHRYLHAQKAQTK